jgi:hypothetical protein
MPALAPSTILHRAHADNTINNVAAYVIGVDNLLRQERLGHYPGGVRRSLDRRAVTGGVIITGQRELLRVECTPMLQGSLRAAGRWFWPLSPGSFG